MNVNEKTILEHCKEGYILLKSLTTSMSQSTLYRTTKNLLDIGYLEKKKDSYKTTKSGLYVLEQDEIPIDWDEMDNIYPHLKFTPTKLHRSVAELLLAAIVSRRDEIKMGHHPTFILMGETMKWKTWFAKFMCLVLGLDTTKNIILMSSESGRSIFIRRGSKGKAKFTRDILNDTLVCFDEYNQAPPDIQKLCRIYLQGEKKVSFENEVLTIEPVPVFTLNPKKGDKLEEKIGLDEPQVRRSIICDFNECTIPSSLAIHGDEILEKAMTLNTIELPGYRKDCTSYKESVHTLLQRCTKNDKIRLIDMDMIIMLCSGMTAFLPEKKAVAYTLRNYLTVIETLGWVQPYWRKELDGFMRVLMIDGDYPNNPPVINTSPIPEYDSGEKRKNRSDNGINWTIKVGELKNKLEENNISIDEVTGFIHFHRELERQGFGTREASTISKEVGKHGLDETVELIKKYGSLNSAIRSLTEKMDKLKQEVKALEDTRSSIISTINRAGSSQERVEELLRVDTILKKQGIKLLRLEEFIQTHLEMKELGFDQETVRLLVKEFDKKKGVKESASILVRNVGSAGDLEKAIEEKKRYMKDLENEKKKIKNRIDDLKSEVSKLTKNVSILEREVTELEKEKSKLNDLINDLKEEIDNQWMKFDRIEGVNRNYKKVQQIIENIEKTIDVRKKRLDEVTRKHHELEDEIILVKGWLKFMFSKNFQENYFPWYQLRKLLEIRENERPDDGIWDENTTDQVRQGMIDNFCDHVEKEIIPIWKHESELDKQKKMFESELKTKEKMIKNHQIKIKEIETNLEKSYETIHEKSNQLNDINKEYENLNEQQLKLIENLQNDFQNENEEYKGIIEKQFKMIENLKHENEEYKKYSFA